MLHGVTLLVLTPASKGQHTLNSTELEEEEEEQAEETVEGFDQVQQQQPCEG